MDTAVGGGRFCRRRPGASGCCSHLPCIVAVVRGICAQTRQHSCVSHEAKGAVLQHAWCADSSVPGSCSAQSFCRRVGQGLDLHLAPQPVHRPDEAHLDPVCRLRRARLWAGGTAVWLPGVLVRSTTVVCCPGVCRDVATWFTPCLHLRVAQSITAAQQYSGTVASRPHPPLLQQMHRVA